MTELLPLVDRFGWFGALLFGVIGGVKAYALWQKRTQQVAGETLTGAIEPLNSAIASLQQSVKELNEYRDGQRSFFEQVGRDVAEAMAASRRAESIAAETRGYTAAVQAQLSTHISRTPHNHNGSGAGYSDP